MENDGDILCVDHFPVSLYRSISRFCRSKAGEALEDWWQLIAQTAPSCSTQVGFRPRFVMVTNVNPGLPSGKRLHSYRK